jgi:hypothetical protein
MIDLANRSRHSAHGIAAAIETRRERVLVIGALLRRQSGTVHRRVRAACLGFTAPAVGQSLRYRFHVARACGARGGQASGRSAGRWTARRLIARLLLRGRLRIGQTLIARPQREIRAMPSGLLIRGFCSAHALLAGLRGLPAASALQRFVLGRAGPYRGCIIRRECGTRCQRRCDPKNRVPLRHRPLLYLSPLAETTEHEADADRDGDCLPRVGADVSNGRIGRSTGSSNQRISRYCSILSSATQRSLGSRSGHRDRLSGLIRRSPQQSFRVVRERPKLRNHTLTRKTQRTGTCHTPIIITHSSLLRSRDRTGMRVYAVINALRWCNDSKNAQQVQRHQSKNRNAQGPQDNVPHVSDSFEVRWVKRGEITASTVQHPRSTHCGRAMPTTVRRNRCASPATTPEQRPSTNSPARSV